MPRHTAVPLARLTFHVPEHLLEAACRAIAPYAALCPDASVSIASWPGRQDIVSGVAMPVSGSAMPTSGETMSVSGEVKPISGATMPVPGAVMPTSGTAMPAAFARTAMSAFREASRARGTFPAGRRQGLTQPELDMLLGGAAG